MVNRSFRRQNPDLFGGVLASPADTGISQTDERVPDGHNTEGAIPEDLIGNGERVTWDAALYG